MVDIYNSWLKRTEDIDCDCEYCGNERYFFRQSHITDRSRDDRPTLYACPVCNFKDLQITQKTDYLPLSKFVKVKNGEMSVNELDNK